ncbi:hypothetical protein RI367_005668 [Sorochytrium milnesiophthora]
MASLDKAAPFENLQRQKSMIERRWAGLGVLLVIFLVRVFVSHRWYIITYGLGIYLLNCFLLFLSPRLDPAMAENEQDMEDGPALPFKSDDEFRPFIRRLPEFKFWYNAVRATLMSLFCTLFEIFDVPVFWPILVFYFITLFALTMRRQIQHMIKYRYVPFTVGKKRYGNRK